MNRTMEAFEATESMNEYFRGFEWFEGVLMGWKDGERVLYVYVTCLNHRELRALGDDWDGFRCVLVQTSSGEGIFENFEEILSLA